MSVEDVLQKVLETRPGVHVNLNKLIEQQRLEEEEKRAYELHLKEIEFNNKAIGNLIKAIVIIFIVIVVFSTIFK